MRTPIKRWLEVLHEWSSPFYRERATYHHYLRVRVVCWLRWLWGAVLAALFGYMITLGSLAMVIIGLDYKLPDLTSAEMITIYVSHVCQPMRACNQYAIYGAILSIATATILIGWIIWFLMLGDTTYKPEPVSDRELAELRELGYIVMETEDFQNAIREYAADRHHPGAGLVGSVQPSQLGAAGPVDCGPDPLPEIYPEAARAD